MDIVIPADEFSALRAKVAHQAAVIEKCREALEWKQAYCSQAIHKAQVEPLVSKALSAIKELCTDLQTD